MLGSAYALVPKRISLVPRLIVLSLAHFFAPEAEREKLPEHPNYYGKRGLVGISNDLSMSARIFAACCAQGKFRVTMDEDFAGVVEACAAPRPGKLPLTWVTPRIMEAYWNAYKAGYAHSVEVWDADGRLVGGLYGMAIGKVFFGESQFSAVERTSKIALVALHRHLREWGFHVRDGKWMTPHLASFGFKGVPREEYRALLRRHVEEPGRVGRWSVDPSLDLSDWPGTPSQDVIETKTPASLKVA